MNPDLRNQSDGPLQMDIPPITFGLRFKRLLSLSEHTQAHAASLLGRTTQYIWMVANDRARPGREFIADLARIYNLDPAEWLQYAGHGTTAGAVDDHVDTLEQAAQRVTAQMEEQLAVRIRNEVEEATIRRLGWRHNEAFGGHVRVLVGDNPPDRLGGFSFPLDTSEVLVAAILRGYVPPRSVLFDFATDLGLTATDAAALYSVAGYGKWEPYREFASQVAQIFDSVRPPFYHIVSPPREERDYDVSPVDVSNWVSAVLDDVWDVQDTTTEPLGDGMWRITLPANPHGRTDTRFEPLTASDAVAADDRPGRRAPQEDTNSPKFRRLARSVGETFIVGPEGRLTHADDGDAPSDGRAYLGHELSTLSRTLEWGSSDEVITIIKTFAADLDLGVAQCIARKIREAMNLWDSQPADTQSLFTPEETRPPLSWIVRRSTAKAITETLRDEAEEQCDDFCTQWKEAIEEYFDRYSEYVDGCLSRGLPIVTASPPPLAEEWSKAESFDWSNWVQEVSMLSAISQASAANTKADVVQKPRPFIRLFGDSPVITSEPNP